jgi:hypothetical protein
VARVVGQTRIRINVGPSETGNCNRPCERLCVPPPVVAGRPAACANGEATEVKDAAKKAKRDAANKIKALEGEVSAAKEAAAKAEQVRKEAETKLKVLEEKPAPKNPANAKPTTK